MKIITFQRKEKHFNTLENGMAAYERYVQRNPQHDIRITAENKHQMAVCTIQKQRKI
jgi:hypothetical protein